MLGRPKTATYGKDRLTGATEDPAKVKVKVRVVAAANLAEAFGHLNRKVHRQVSQTLHLEL